MENEIKDIENENIISGGTNIEEDENQNRLTNIDKNNRFTDVGNNLYDDNDDDYIEGYDDPQKQESNQNSNNNNNNNNLSNSNQSNNNNNNKNTTEIQGAETGLFGLEKVDFKVILIGDYGVGKTSLINRFLTNNFSSENNNNNIEKSKTLNLDQSTITKLILTDTNGEEQYGSIPKNYYKDAHGAILMYDITNKESFEKIPNYINEIKENCPKDIIIMIIGSKCDDGTNRKISENDGKNIAVQNNCLFCEVSSKNGLNVALTFENLAFSMLEKYNEMKDKEDKVQRKKERKSFGLEEVEKKIKKKKKCCKK